MKDMKEYIRTGRLMPAMTFNEKVWALTSRIPAGTVTTYGELARALKTSGCRAVGNALRRNPYAPQVPCHRVVGSDGNLTGYAGGLAAKRRMLQREGVVFYGSKVSVKHIHRFSCG